MHRVSTTTLLLFFYTLICCSCAPRSASDTDILSSACDCDSIPGTLLQWRFSGRTLTIEGPRNAPDALPDYASGDATPWAAHRSDIRIISLSGITHVGSHAFAGCSRAEHLFFMHDAVSIGAGAFAGCVALPAVDLPQTIVAIDSGAFAGCSSLQSVNLPPALEVIRPATFLDCRSLPSVILPRNLTAIEASAFAGCSRLTSVNLPARIERLGPNVFDGCIALTGVRVNWTAEQFPDMPRGGIFGGVDTKGLTLSIPVGLARSTCEAAGWTGFGRYVETAAPYFSGVFGDGHTLTWAFCDSTGTLTVGGAGVMPDYTRAARPPWHASGQIASVVVEPGVTSIGAYAFAVCRSLKSVAFAPSPALTSIGEAAFFDCKALESIVLPERLTSIGARAFYACNSLISLALPATVTAIGGEAFADCLDLAAITVAPDNPSFADNDGVLFDRDGKSLICYPPQKAGNSYTVPPSVTVIGEAAFYSCRALESILLPASLTTIGDHAFSGCNSLTSLALSATVTAIGTEAFSSCSYLTAITVAPDNPSFRSKDGVLFDRDGKSLICYPPQKAGSRYTVPATVTVIGEKAFSGCHALKSVTLPASLTVIGEGAFSFCSELKSIAFPAAVTAIGRDAFSYCHGLTDVTVNWSVVPTDISVTDIFSSVTLSDATLHLPADADAGAYEAAGWTSGSSGRTGFARIKKIRK
jgi:hypothetical protein